MKTFLDTGDVFIVEKGMTVYAEIPKRFIYANTRLDMSLDRTDIKVGEIKVAPKINVENESEQIVKHLSDVLSREEKAKIKEEIKSILQRRKPLPDTFDTSIFEGTYVVTRTAMSGGGTGHGPHDVYPDGYKVAAIKLSNGETFNPKGLKISFYQSGCFTAMIYPSRIKKIKTMSVSFN